MNEVNGLPTHILLVHAVVVLLPLAAVLVAVTAWWPTLRRKLGVLTPLLTVGATFLVPLTTHYGEWLEGHVPHSDLVEVHAELGDQILPWALALSACRSGSGSGADTSTPGTARQPPGPLDRDRRRDPRRRRRGGHDRRSRARRRLRGAGHLGRQGLDAAVQRRRRRLTRWSSGRAEPLQQPPYVRIDDRLLGGAGHLDSRAPGAVGDLAAELRVGELRGDLPEHPRRASGSGTAAGVPVGVDK